MAIDAVNDKQKKALMSLILVPVWESIKCQGDDCKAKESKKKKHGTVPASGQPQDLQIEHKYHGSKLLSLKNSDIVYHHRDRSCLLYLLTHPMEILIKYLMMHNTIL